MTVRQPWRRTGRKAEALRTRRHTRVGGACSCARGHRIAAVMPTRRLTTTPSRLNTVQHGARAEPRTVQHLCSRGTTPRHGFLMFPKPGVGCSIQPGGTTSCLHMGTFSGRDSGRLALNRPKCRHSADETPRHATSRQRPGITWQHVEIRGAALPPQGVGASSLLRRRRPRDDGSDHLSLGFGVLLHRGYDTIAAGDVAALVRVDVPATQGVHAAALY